MTEPKGVAIGSGRLIDVHALVDELIAGGATGIVLIGIGKQLTVEPFGDGSLGSLAIAGALLTQLSLDLFHEEDEDDET